ncbi:MAG: hypothetical protein JWQ32_600 [Marmoricola sp.]|nr:hypothetical protein [Marmoricola sp.]
MSNDKAAEAREGFLDSVAGKAKEFVGAVSGKDDLVEEGQLQQAEAARRKDALADEAVAEAKREHATDKVRESTHEASVQTGAANAQAARAESEIEQQREQERAAAERDAARLEAAGQESAEERADNLAATRLREAEALAADASRTEENAAGEKSRLERQAAADDHKAAQLRAQTEK